MLKCDMLWKYHLPAFTKTTFVPYHFRCTGKKTINKQSASRGKYAISLYVPPPSTPCSLSLSRKTCSPSLLLLEILHICSENESALESWREHEVSFSSWAIKTSKLYSSLLTFACLLSSRYFLSNSSRKLSFFVLLMFFLVSLYI